MISFLTNSMTEAVYSDSIEETLPILKQLQIIDENFVPNTGADYSENLQEIIAKIYECNHPSIFSFDSECIENAGDYADLTKNLFESASLLPTIEKIKSDYNPDTEKAGIAIKLNGKTIKNIWDQNSDYVSPKYIDFIDQFLDQNFNKKLLMFPAVDQSCSLLVIPKDQYEPLNKFFTFSEKGLDENSIYRNKCWVIIVVTVLGFLLTPFIGWYFFGFWKSALFSLIFWLSFGCYKLFKAAGAIVEIEETENFKNEDPELFTQSLKFALLEEAAKRERNSPMGKRLKAVAEYQKKELEAKIIDKAKDPA